MPVKVRFAYSGDEDISALIMDNLKAGVDAEEVSEILREELAITDELDFFNDGLETFTIEEIDGEADSRIL
ncbi:hypothetical protein FHX68_1519 [Microbacterium lacticum]|uniref:Uncharacterized protein n=1 Tax=Microbacterium lacticum TaxID=33885 RepID=A0A543KUV3_9MICO|nr:hypothetical protein [Microbacterium lacticum]TQM98807.1 hypothetical protein FHX68_1519 [Microbacterium lacticum]